MLISAILYFASISLEITVFTSARFWCSL